MLVPQYEGWNACGWEVAFDGQTDDELCADGDPKARDWLARYLIGPEPMTLLALAADELATFTTDKLVERECASRRQNRFLLDVCQVLNATKPEE